MTSEAPDSLPPVEISSFPPDFQPPMPEQDPGPGPNRTQIQVRIEDLQKERIFVATPCYGGALT